MPTKVTAENIQSYLNSTGSNTTAPTTSDDLTMNSDHSTYRTNYEFDGNESVSSDFFKKLDQDTAAKFRGTITRPDVHAILSSLPTPTTPSSGSSIASGTMESIFDDPIDELDAIIDNDDLTMTFHDPLDDLFNDDEMLEVINPNLKVPRPQVDSKPTGRFSVR